MCQKMRTFAQTYLAMDNKDFVGHIASELGITGSQVSVLVEAFASVIKQEASDVNAVAIPSFGTFEAVKEDERIIRDLSTGHRLLMPPSISLKFNAATALRKRVLR